MDKINIPNADVSIVFIVIAPNLNVRFQEDMTPGPNRVYISMRPTVPTPPRP